MTLAVASRLLLVFSLVVLAASSVTAGALRIALTLAVYETLPPPPHRAPPNPFGFRLEDVRVDGRTVVGDTPLVIGQSDSNTVTGRVFPPPVSSEQSEPEADSDYSFFLITINKAGHFTSTLQGELQFAVGGEWSLIVDINHDDCFYRYPTLFVVVVTVQPTTAQLRKLYRPPGSREALPELSWFEAGQFYVHKRTQTASLRTCFGDQGLPT